jgi:hypothetical protein
MADYAALWRFPVVLNHRAAVAKLAWRLRESGDAGNKAPRQGVLRCKTEKNTDYPYPDNKNQPSEMTITITETQYKSMIILRLPVSRE